MLIDENKIRNKSKTLTGGFKGVVPRMSKNRNTSKLDYMRMVVGFALTTAMVVGTAILLWNLLSVGKEIAERKSTPKKPEYIEVIFKPKQK